MYYETALHSDHEVLKALVVPALGGREKTLRSKRSTRGFDVCCFGFHIRRAAPVGDLDQIVPEFLSACKAIWDISQTNESKQIYHGLLILSRAYI